MIKRIPLKGEGEEDTFSGWRHYLCYLRRPGRKRFYKRKYNRRFRAFARKMLREAGRNG